jgi:hypothetical protein
MTGSWLRSFRKICIGYGVRCLICALVVAWLVSDPKPAKLDPLDDSHGVVLRHWAVVCDSEADLRQALKRQWEAKQIGSNLLPQLRCSRGPGEPAVTTLEKRDTIRLIRIPRAYQPGTVDRWVRDADLQSTESANRLRPGPMRCGLLWGRPCKSASS